MTSTPVAFLLADLGVTKTHSRPHVSDDNPYSESQFTTMKYRPEFPDRFGSIQVGRAFCQRFFPWYNDEHRHSGIGLLAPATMHFGLAGQAQQQRQTVLSAVCQQHPKRFVHRYPRPFVIPKEVWINKPPTTDPDTQEIPREGVAKLLTRAGFRESAGRGICVVHGLELPKTEWDDLP